MKACNLLFLLCSVAAFSQPQTFSSGSTGADGALTYAPSLGTVYFPPSGIAVHSNGIYNFTTITVGLNTTVRFSGWVINTPIYLLAQGDVNISGTLDLSGRNGYDDRDGASVRSPSEPGSGGYSGGVGRVASAQAASAGNGPGGGAVTTSNCGGGGSYTGNTYLQPLVGGSGGAGGCSTSTTGCGGGGAGGGAILIASSTQIILGGSSRINANGGSVAYISVNSTGGVWAGGGSGGSVRLVSNSITFNGGSGINVFGGSGSSNGACGSPTGSPANSGANGLARAECFNGCDSAPYALNLPANGVSSVSVTSVNGTAVNANPFTFPDVTVATSSPVSVVISATNIPPGTTGNLYIYSETAPDQILPFTLAGTLASTTATVSVTVPPGGSRGFAKVTWMSH